MDSNALVVKSERSDDGGYSSAGIHARSGTAKRGSKHSRSKSQTFITFPNTDEEISKHFDRSLNQNQHLKSKSLPRPMTERNLPSSFFIETTINSSSCDSLRHMSDLQKEKCIRNRNRNRTKSKDQIKKTNSIYNKKHLETLHVKSEPLSPLSPSLSGSLKVSSPSSCYSSCSSPQSQPPQSQQATQHQPIIGHHRSRSCPVQPVPQIPTRKKNINITLPIGTSMYSNSGSAVDIEIDINRIRLPSNWAIGNQNGALYFVDHQNKTTTYEDPRTRIRNELLREHKLLCDLNEASHLPDGYDRLVTQDTRQIFFVNHNTKKTSWIHPKVEMNLIPDEELNSYQTGDNMDIEQSHFSPLEQTSQFNQNNFYQKEFNKHSNQIQNPIMNQLSNEFSEPKWNDADLYQQHQPQSQFNHQFKNYIDQTVGYNNARLMHQGTSSSLPSRFHDFRSRPNQYSQEPSVGHRRQRSLDQLPIDQLRIMDTQTRMTAEDINLIKEIDVQPFEDPLSDEVLSQLLKTIAN